MTFPPLSPGVGGIGRLNYCRVFARWFRGLLQQDVALPEVG
jgi:hypothetical protein